MVGTNQDVTERKEREAELQAAKEAAEEANRLKSAFLSTMSHELRSPLTAVLGYAELLKMEGGLAPAQAEDVAQIVRSADHLLALIDDVLDLSRIEAGRMELDLEEVDPAAVAEEVRAVVARAAAAKGLALRVEVPSGLPHLWADPLRLRQVLLNLTANAVKFTEQGEVRVEAREAAGGIEVAVTDTGIGIAPEALPHVFDEFRQADAGTSRRFGGTGLGLAISQRLVEMHGGALGVESEPGVGSTFTLFLPVSDSSVSANRPRSPVID
jgi:signal transduction histidine kinase